MTILTKPASLLAMLALLVVAASVGGPSNDIEVSIMRSLAWFRADQPGLTNPVRGITTLGSVYATLGATSLASLWLLLRRSPAQALLLALTVLIERVLVDAFKGWLGRPRPQFELDWLPQSLAFPSGHSANSMTAYLATALILAPPAHRRPWAIGALTLSLVVGLSRIYLGVHWPSDVIGGWALGLLAVGAALLVGERSDALHFEPQHEVVGRHRPPLGEDEAA